MATSAPILTWRAIEQHSTRWLHVEALEDFRVEQRQQHHFLESAEVAIQASNTRPGH